MTASNFNFVYASFLSTKSPLLLLKTWLNFKLGKNMQLNPKNWNVEVTATGLEPRTT